MYKIGGVLLNGTDNIIIGVFDGLISIGVLANYSMITGGIQALIAKTTGGLKGSIGNLIAKEDPQKQEAMLYNITFLNFILYGMCFVGCMGALNPFIRLWAGEEYVLSFWVVFVHCFNIFIEGTMSPVWTFRTTMGLFSYGRFLPLVAAGINLVTSIWLGKNMGLIGVLLGTTISRFCTGIWPAPYIVYHYGFKKKAREYYFKWFRNVFVVFANVGVVFLYSTYLKLNGVAAIFVYGIFAVIIFTLSVIVLYKNAPELKYFIEVAKQVIKKIEKRKGASSTN